jgi:excinuclease ABC subunit B
VKAASNTIGPGRKRPSKAYLEPDGLNIAADPVMKYMNADDLEHSIDITRKKMQKAAKDQDFMEAARLRDELFVLMKAKE